MSGGYSLDEEAFQRMRRSILWTESQRAFDGGDIAASPTRPEEELWFQTADTEPAAYDGSQGFPGQVCYLDADGAPQVLKDGLAYDPNGGKLSSGETYRVRFDRLETVSGALVPRYWIVSGIGQANEPAIEFVFPWRILTINFTKGEYWTQDWSAPYPVFVKNPYLWFQPSRSSLYGGTLVDVPDCSKWKSPGDPYYTDQAAQYIWDNNLDLFIAFSFDPFPTVSLNNTFLTYPDPYSLSYQEIFYAASHWMCPWRAEFLGSPLLACKFTTAPAAYINGYGGKKIPVKWNNIPSEEVYWNSAGKRVIAQPFVAMVKPVKTTAITTFGVSDPIPYFKSNGQQSSFYFWFDDPFNLLSRTTSAYQKVLVSPVANMSDGIGINGTGNGGMSTAAGQRTRWIITQIYHQTSPNQTTASGTSGSAIGSGSSLSSGYSYTDPATGLVNPNSFAVSSGASGGSGGGSFTAGTGGVE